MALLGSAQVEREVTAWVDRGENLSEAGARTIASYYHSPSPLSFNITALSHGLLDRVEWPLLHFELERELREAQAQSVYARMRELRALLAWVGSHIPVREVYHHGTERWERACTYAELEKRLWAEAEHATDETTRENRRANVAACLVDLLILERGEWGWSTYLLAPMEDEA